MSLLRRRARAVAAAAVLPLLVLAPAARADGWSMYERLGFAGHSSRSPQLSMGAGGDITAGIADLRDGALVVQSREASAGGWAPPVRLSTPGTELVDFQVATSDEDASAVAVWTEQVVDRTNPGMPIPRPAAMRVAVRSAAGVWGAPTSLTSAIGAHAPSVAWAGDGHVVAVWSDPIGVRSATRAPDGTWGEPATVGPTSPSTPTEMTAVAFRPDGSAVAIWQRPLSIMSAVRHGATWSPSVRLGIGGGQDLAVDGRGHALVVWSSGSAAWLSELGRDDVWAPARRLSAESTDSHRAPTVDVAPDGTAAVGWAHAASPPYAQMIVRRDEHGRWSAPDEIGLGGSDGPRIVAADGGRVTAAWPAFDSSVAATRTFDGAAWSSMIGLPHSHAGGAPAVSGDHRGSVALASTPWGSTSVVSLLDGSGPAIRDLRVPATAGVGRAIALSAAPVDAFSALGTTTWDFGDGTATATGTRVNHTYAAPGTYTVRVTAQDALGHLTTTTRSIVVAGGASEPAPITTARNPELPAPAAPLGAGAAASAPAGPAIQLARRQRLRTLLARRGMRTAVTTPGAGSVRVTATVSGATARRLGLRSARLATAIRRAGAAGTLPVTLRLPAAVRRRAERLRRLDVTVTLVFTAADGRQTTAVDRLSSRA